MAAKLNYTPETILNVKFSPKEKGYDPLEVDKIFDGIISDYKSLCKNIEELSKSNDSKQQELQAYKKEQKNLEFEIASLKKKLESLPKVNGVTDDNYILLKKIAAYERVLYKKGIDPNKALSDPDNC